MDIKLDQSDIIGESFVRFQHFLEESEGIQYSLIFYWSSWGYVSEAIQVFKEGNFRGHVVDPLGAPPTWLGDLLEGELAYF